MVDRNYSTRQIQYCSFHNCSNNCNGEGLLLHRVFFQFHFFLPNRVAQIGEGPILCQDKVYSEMAFIGDLNGLKVLKSEGHK